MKTTLRVIIEIEGEEGGIKNPRMTIAAARLKEVPSPSAHLGDGDMATDVQMVEDEEVIALALKEALKRLSRRARNVAPIDLLRRKFRRSN